MFGGFDTCMPVRKFTNALWELHRTSEGSFAWYEGHKCEKINSPSPRCCHRGWEYAGKLWIFEGECNVTHSYLNDYGDFAPTVWQDTSFTNQLLCFNPSHKQWSSPKCTGSIPAPRSGHAAAVLGSEVWLYGGYGGTVAQNMFDDLYKLNMCSFTWTLIQTDYPKPQGRSFTSLTAVSHNKLVLHAGSQSTCMYFPSLDDTWILDLGSQKWQNYTSATDHPPRSLHTGSVGINSSAIVTGISRYYPPSSCDGNITTIHVMLEPRSLQQLALQTIYDHSDDLPWKCLPEKLISYLGTHET